MLYQNFQIVGQTLVQEVLLNAINQVFGYFSKSNTNILVNKTLYYFFLNLK